MGSHTWQRLQKSSNSTPSMRAEQRRSHALVLSGLITRLPLGNHLHQQLMRTGLLRAKLAIGGPSDSYEHEADQVADRVMSIPDAAITGTASGVTPQAAPGLQRMCIDCEEIRRQPLDQRAAQPVVDTDTLFPPEELKQDEEEERLVGQTIMTKRIGSSGSFVAPRSTEAQLAESVPGGVPLDAEVRGFMEPRFGASLADVRTHTDGRASSLCANLGAKAFTYGREIYFGAGWYKPSTTEGKRLLAHELTHVQQQRQTGTDAPFGSHPAIQRACQHFPAHTDPDTYCETEAEARANITRACPPHRDDFLYRDGPATHPWRRIPGYGCAHHVAHILGITNGAGWENCRGGFSVTIGQVTQGRAMHPLADAQVSDIWSTGIHSGVVTEVDTTVPRVRVDQCGTGGNAQTIWRNDGSVYR